MQNKMEAFLIPLMALAAASILFAIFTQANGVAPSDLFYSIYRGAFGSWFSWQNTLVRAAPLVLTALCTALPARIGLIIIGGEGAVVMGGLMAALTGIALNGSAPPWLVVTCMAFVGMLCGGAWIGFVGAIKYYRGVNETISSLLLNYVAIALLNFLVVGPLKDPATLNKPSTHSVGDINMIGAIGDSSIHWGLVFAAVFCLLMYILYRRTTFGFAVDVSGGNVRAAKLAGLPVGRLMIITCMFAGAAAGAAGMLEVAAIHGRANASLAAGYGYAGILVAFIARHNPVAILPVALLLGGISASSGLVQRAHDLPDATSLVLQGIIFVCILASEPLYGRLNFGKIWQRVRAGSSV